MSSVTHAEVIDGLAAAITGTLDGMTQSSKILDPSTDPATRLHKAFSIDLQTDNTGKLRDRKALAMLLRAEATVRCAWRVNPKDEAATLAAAHSDEDRMVAAVVRNEAAPLNRCSIHYLRSRRRLSASREWYFSDVVFGVQFVRSVLASDNQP